MVDERVIFKESGTEGYHHATNYGMVFKGIETKFVRISHL